MNGHPENVYINKNVTIIAFNCHPKNPYIDKNVTIIAFNCHPENVYINENVTIIAFSSFLCYIITALSYFFFLLDKKSYQ